ncbi:uncharacterized protein LOC106171864 [Lingula anatina]|uniref:Uncharacterized protein LOC106171864 n=1 Tax=Lingula anatina TaxID=7574 RepID=A0A1S3JBM5_LINAN|nr:uncharacterized protein LOC106171864 [Lingula anatina]XP_013407811.1 uncharacterized protein LOC106171864 [Lingula anatina]XP_013407812.1 uncharacterized protein LOC106171864 [Lingula anatina]|eukprot:XP_013407810.1 uncharacterized protein LOC106171864 [Lingula anatina]
MAAYRAYPTSFVCVLLAYCALYAEAGFLRPDFDSGWFNMTADETAANTYKEITHGLGETPIKVKVLGRAIDGNHKGFIFEGTGTSQGDDDFGQPRSGPAYAYNNDVVRIWLPTINNFNPGDNYAIYVGGLWGGNDSTNAQASKTAEFKVLAWLEKSFYTASEVIRTNISRYEFKEVPHTLGATPVYVLARAVIPDDETHGGFVFEGIGSQMMSKGPQSYNAYLGLLYGYNASSIRMWTGMFVMGVSDGWGKNKNNVARTSADVEIYVWADFDSTGLGTYDSGWFRWDQSQKEDYMELHVGMGYLPRFALVQYKAIDGDNQGYIFNAIGTAENDGLTPTQKPQLGGVVFAYGKNSVRLWTPSPDLTGTASIVRIMDLGGNQSIQLSTQADVRVRLWAGKFHQKTACTLGSTYQKMEDMSTTWQTANATTHLGQLTVTGSLKCGRECHCRPDCVAWATPGYVRGNIPTSCDLMGVRFGSDQSLPSDQNLKFYRYVDMDISGWEEN